MGYINYAGFVAKIFDLYFRKAATNQALSLNINRKNGKKFTNWQKIGKLSLKVVEGLILKNIYISSDKERIFDLKLWFLQ